MAVIWNSTRPFVYAINGYIYKGEEVPREYCTPAFLKGAANQILLTGEDAHGEMGKPTTPEGTD